MRRLISGFLAIAFELGFIQHTSAQSEQAPSVEAILAKVRTALAVAEFPSNHPGLKATGKIIHWSVEADVAFLLDGSGRFRLSSDGVLADLRSFDGTDAWATDWTGATRHLLLQDR